MIDDVGEELFAPVRDLCMILRHVLFFFRVESTSQAKILDGLKTCSDEEI